MDGEKAQGGAGATICGGAGIGLPAMNLGGEGN